MGVRDYHQAFTVHHNDQRFLIHSLASPLSCLQLLSSVVDETSVVVSFLLNTILRRQPFPLDVCVGPGVP